MSALVGVPPREIAPLVADLWPLLEELCAQSHGKFLPNDMLRAVETGEWQLWGWLDDRRLTGALLTRIVIYPQRKILEFVGLAGPDRSEWMKYLGLVERWGRMRGCSGVEAEGRDGWVRVMAPHGYRKDRVVIAKDF